MFELPTMTNEMNVSIADFKGALSSMEEGRISSSSTSMVSTHSFLLDVITSTILSRFCPLKPLFSKILRICSRSCSGLRSINRSSLDCSRLDGKLYEIENVILLCVLDFRLCTKITSN